MPCETANDRARDSEMARMLDLLRRSQENQHALMREHLEALSRLGPTPIHRRSFAPVSESSSLRCDAPAG